MSSYAATPLQPQNFKNNKIMIHHHNHNSLRIPLGNDFRLAICRDDVAPANLPEVTFQHVQDLNACIVSPLGRRIQLQHQVMTDGDLLLTVRAEPLRCVDYAVEITGRFQGHMWRWRASKCFTIVRDNRHANMGEFESFDIETYYLHDKLTAQIVDDIEGETLELITHSQASIVNGEISITADNVTLSDDGEELIITI